MTWADSRSSSSFKTHKSKSYTVMLPRRSSGDTSGQMCEKLNSNKSNKLIRSIIMFSLAHKMTTNEKKEREKSYTWTSQCSSRDGTENNVLVGQWWHCSCEPAQDRCISKNEAFEEWKQRGRKGGWDGNRTQKHAHKMRRHLLHSSKTQMPDGFVLNITSSDWQTRRQDEKVCIGDEIVSVRVCLCGNIVWQI